MSAQDVNKAVQIALDASADPAIKEQATSFLNSLKDTAGGCTLCLEVFSSGQTSDASTRLVVLQLLVEAVRSGTVLSVFPDFLKVLQEKLWAYILARQFVGEPPYINNTLQHLLSLLLVRTYPQQWPDFFSGFHTLIDGVGTGAGDAVVEFYAKTLLAIGEEIGDVLTPHTSEEMQRIADVKDAIRSNDVSNIISHVYNTMLRSSEANKNNLVELCLQVIANWVSWIDINFVVNEPFLNALYSFLQSNDLRNTTCRTLVEIVYKKMKPPEKLNILNLLNLNYFISQLRQQSEADPAFDEELARLVNAQGVELVNICLNASSAGLGADAVESASALLSQTLGHLIYYLSNEYDETSEAVFPFLTDVLTMLRKEASGAKTMDSTRQELLVSILNAVVKKMKYDDSEEWDDDAESEEEAEFLELRKKLKTFQDAIGAIDSKLYNEYMYDAISTSVTNAASMSAGRSWQLMEFALFELYIFGEGVKGSAAFITADKQPTNLSRLLALVIGANVCSACPHPLVQMLYMDILVRYAGFFEYEPKLVYPAVEFFLSDMGIHSTNTRVCVRAWYLYYKFLKSVPRHIPEFAAVALKMQSDLLTVSDNNINPADFPQSSIETLVRQCSFNSRLYLFEAAGILVSGSSQALSDADKSAFCDSLISTLQNQLTQGLSSGLDSFDNLVRVYCSILAIGNLAKGFPPFSDRSGPWVSCFNTAAEVLFQALQACSTVVDIRTATRFSFARIVSVLGPSMLPKIPQLVDLLLSSITTDELTDLLSFLGQLSHLYKAELVSVINSLLGTLLTRIFASLAQQPQGTDDAIKQNDLRKSYVAFLVMLVNRGFSQVFFTEQNQQYFDGVLQSVLHFANSIGDPSIQKSSIALLSKMVVMWGGDGGIGGFETFMYSSLLPLCFEMPFNQSFNVSDGMSHVVLGELALLQKSILQVKGPSFVEYLTSVYFPSVNFPQALVGEYAESLTTLADRAFKQYFQKFIQSMKN
ncbi:karyopherin Los1 [Schizosaccharomyces japonicus yFS275]|uniref:Exportin-T n=1 Tax=Schizosaccharomyces japonicus (strain yFS275 / FY16936) TaxID=402676 RepID=B6K0U6_SCHJY|nr:karyopherin Los1 [Schizosaccharomyces japonicus yFS275]EEB07567.1 karyopherin Los1 [Schizosaccharomyces japonicus yFS275]